MTTPTERIVVVGGTSVIAQHTLRTWLENRDATVHLIGRSKSRLASVEADLRVRLPGSRFSHEAIDLCDIAAIKRVTEQQTANGAPDIVLIAHGALASQTDSQKSLHAASDQLITTGVSPALWLEAFAARMATGTLAVIGSVAGDRGRRSNYLYGAAKSLIERVVQGLQHRYAGTDLHIVLIKPGPTRTPMTEHLALAGVRLADVHQVAEAIAQAVRKHRRVAYVPGRWRLIMTIVCAIPAPLFNRLDL